MMQNPTDYRAMLRHGDMKKNLCYYWAFTIPIKNSFR